MTNASKIWAMGAAFIVIAPLSTSGGVIGILKWLRLLTTVLAFYFSVSNIKIPERLGGARSLSNFVLLFTFAALWSDYPVMGMVNKGMFFFTVMMGLAMSYSAVSAKDLLEKLNMIGYVGGTSSLSLAYVFITNKEQNLVGDRLAVAGMNANTIGAAGALLLLLAVYLIFKSERTINKVVHLSSAIFLLAIVLGTGSRGALLMCAVGLFFILKPILSKNAMSIFVVCLIPFIVLQIYGAISTNEDTVTPGIDRLANMNMETKNTRSGMWNWTIKKFNESPVIGKGWLSWGGTTSANTHNVYLHVLAESGVIGGVVFLGMLFRLFSIYRVNTSSLKAGMDPYDFTPLGAGILASVLLHGMVESSTILGTSTNVLFLGFAVGLLDRATLLNSDKQSPLKVEKDQYHPWAFQRDQNTPESPPTSN
ncbi:O-antigen ligase family protein [Verrucomicrobia bacterium]|nr:O-antigen ligase family protein [Verrucomicrobiota bacterium]